MKNSTNSYPKFGLKSHLPLLYFTIGHICYNRICIGPITYVSSGFPFALEAPWTKPLFHVVFMGSQDISAVLLSLSPIFFLPIILTKFMFTCCNGGIEGVVPQLGFVARSVRPFTSPAWWSNMAFCTRLAIKCTTQCRTKMGPIITTGIWK